MKTVQQYTDEVLHTPALLDSLLLTLDNHGKGKTGINPESDRVASQIAAVIVRRYIKLVNIDHKENNDD